MDGSAYSWRVDHRYGVQWLILLDAKGKELRSRMCQAKEPATQLAFVESMIRDYEKLAGQAKPL